MGCSGSGGLKEAVNDMMLVKYDTEPKFTATYNLPDDNEYPLFSAQFKGRVVPTNCHIIVDGTEVPKETYTKTIKGAGEHKVEFVFFLKEGIDKMESMFEGITYLIEVDMSQFGVRHLDSMKCAFKGCTGLTKVNVKGWEVTKVKDFSEMFAGCTALTEIDIADWTPGVAENLTSMFEGCTNLTVADTSKWIFNNPGAVKKDNMFKDTQVKEPEAAPAEAPAEAQAGGEEPAAR
ncbi:MAG: DUF285 domain-containing protein [archaeon]|nr:DUF285 domain-containing protein [archaeon]